VPRPRKHLYRHSNIICQAGVNPEQAFGHLAVPGIFYEESRARSAASVFSISRSQICAGSFVRDSCQL